jgi:hypothetical protein
MPRLLSLHGVLEAEETLRGLVELRGRGKGFGHGITKSPVARRSGWTPSTLQGSNITQINYSLGSNGELPNLFETKVQG